MADMAALLEQKKLREVTVPVSVGGDGTTAPFVVRALPRLEYRKLVEDHAVEDGPWDEATFPPALIAACVVDPSMTVDQATTVWNEWEAGETGRLFLECWRLNEQAAGVSFTLPGSEKTIGSGRKSNTASTKA